MEIYVNGKKITLNQNQFVAKGGEGSIYKRDNLAFKIYENPKDMIPTGKIQELQVLDNPFIVKPKDIIYDANQKIIGFTSDWANDGVVLCRLFTNNFRNTASITNDSTIELVEHIKDTTHFVHQKKCLIVDHNELNSLAVAPNYKTAYFIDVNSWATPNYPATAIMPTIRDWTTAEFNVLTDWFSFAVIAFQLFTGIHPFKGKHKDPKLDDLTYRVQNHISVFNKNVNIPSNTRDFNLIPNQYKDWFFSLFEKGKREVPPALPGSVGVAQVLIKLIRSTEKLEITELRELVENILYHNAEWNVTKTEKTLWINKTDYTVGRDVEILFTALERFPILVKIVNKKVEFKGLGIPVTPIDIDCDDKMIVNNTLYLKSQGNLIEMTFKVFNGTITPIIKTVWNIEPLSSTMFSNVIFQSLLGKPFIAIPLPSFKDSSFIVKDIPELDKAQVLDAKYDNKVCMIIYHKNFSYNKMILTFNDDFSKYDVRIIKDITYGPINFISLNNGICIHILEDGKLEVFFNKYGSTQIKIVEDKDISTEMHLVKDDTKVKFFMQNKIYSVTLKK
jgi:serine/threonine protein kinase